MLFAVSILALFAYASATQCPPPGSVRYMVPHESDCSKFYICAHGIPLLQSCPEGTHFNPNFMVCQNPVFAGCSNELPESELECSWADFFQTKPHPDSCNKYYVCEYGTPLVFDCPGGTEFNAELKECVWPHESNCSIGDATVPPQDGGAQDGCVEGALSANQDCSKYNICNHGAEIAQDCPAGLQWSSKLEQCTWPHESDCNNYGSDGNTEPQDSVEQNGGSQDGCVEGALSANQDCSKYNICNHGAEIAQDCPAGLQWSSKLEQCTWPHESDCNNYGSDGNTEPQDSVEQNGGQQDGGSGCEEGALSAHEDCNKYNKCSHGVAIAMDCPSGLHWNSILQYCDWPLTAGCA